MVRRNIGISFAGFSERAERRSVEIHGMLGELASLDDSELRAVIFSMTAKDSVRKSLLKRVREHRARFGGGKNKGGKA